MANISKQKRDRMLAFLEELKKTHSDDASIRAFNEIENHLNVDVLQIYKLQFLCYNKQKLSFVKDLSISILTIQ